MTLAGRARKVSLPCLSFLPSSTLPLSFSRTETFYLLAVMDLGDVDLDMGDSLYGAQSSSAAMAVQQWIDESNEREPCPFTEPTARDQSPETTSSDTELTTHLSGEQTPQNSQAATTPRYDPTALLNPKSSSKRPATSSVPSVSSRSETASTGQVSLVERLHNVHERAASPAKRVKTTEDQQRKKQSSSGSQFGGSGSLDLTKSNGNTPVPQTTTLDLTMSMPATLSLNVKC